MAGCRRRQQHRARARSAEALRALTVHGTGAARHYDAGAEAVCSGVTRPPLPSRYTAAAASGCAWSVSSPDSPVRMR